MSLNIKNEETHRMAQELAALTGESMTAAVTDTDTVTVWFQNGTGGTLNLASGTLTATVIKQ